MFDKIAEYRKAVAAFLVPALVVLGASLVDGVVNWQEWIAVAIAALGTTTFVGTIPNALTDDQVRSGAKHLDDPGALAASLVSEENRRIRANQ